MLEFFSQSAMIFNNNAYDYMAHCSQLKSVTVQWR